MIYYSARLHMVSIVDDPDELRERSYVCDYPFVLFQAADDAAAFARALELGKEREIEYVNSDGNRVHWRLRAVEFIWKLGTEIDGIEVGSLMDVYQPDEELSVDTSFSPESIMPTYSDESHSKLDTSRDA
jgi:Domain of unknown function (DUF4288)